MRRVFSGIQPTGRLHLGNYCGAIRNWVQLQTTQGQSGSDSDLLFSIVDLHAMTTPYAASTLREGVLEMTAALLACGLQPEKGRCVLYLQSDVREHSELAWLLSCVTPLGWLQRMTQFKDKEAARVRLAKAAAKEAKGGGQGTQGPVAGAPLGLLSYPVLQAADILLYKATAVPVGEDQAQHLELARDIAQAFHTAHGCTAAPIFPLPATLLLPTGARIMSLRDGSKKMSKSDPSDDSRINLQDDADSIARKVRGAKTDSEAGWGWDPVGRPEKSNLLTIYAAISGRTVEDVAQQHASSTAVQFKSELSDLLVAHLVPIGQEVSRRLADRDHLLQALRLGGDKARAIAQDTMTEVRQVTGYLRTR